MDIVIAFGTLREGFCVSSDMWADTSEPVAIVQLCHPIM